MKNGGGNGCIGRWGGGGCRRRWRKIRLLLLDVVGESGNDSPPLP